MAATQQERALVVAEPGQAQLPTVARTTTEIMDDQKRIVECMQKVMKDGVDYGTIPGTQKPSLYKPGAEKLGMLFRLAITPVVEDLSGDDIYRYRVTVRVDDQYTGAFLGAGLGECSTDEDQYCWRAALCDEEYDETPDDMRRGKWRKNKRTGEAFKVKQIRTRPADFSNTVLKMAKKRAQVDAILTVTAASAIFTQDVEDIPPELLGGAPAPVGNVQAARTVAPTGVAPGAASGQQQASGGSGVTRDWKDNEVRILTLGVQEFSSQKKENAKGPYTQTFVTFTNGLKASGFHNTFPERLADARKAGGKVVAKLQRKGQYTNLIEIQDVIFEAEAAPAGPGSNDPDDAGYPGDDDFQPTGGGE